MNREAAKVEHSVRPQHKGRIQRRHEHFHMRTGRSRQRVDGDQEGIKQAAVRTGLLPEVVSAAGGAQRGRGQRPGSRASSR